MSFPVPPYSVFKNGFLEKQLSTLEKACDFAESLTFGGAGEIQVRDDETGAFIAERIWRPDTGPNSGVA